MEKLGSILVVAERTGGSAALRKAVILARHFGARIELFLCDAEHAYALRHLYDRRGADEARNACLIDGRHYLDALRATVPGDDVDIDIEVVCESPAYEGVVRKALRSAPDLVLKEIGMVDSHAGSLASTDWHLIRTCPVPLMLTHGRAWHPAPRFAAAIDVSGEESPGLARTIVQTAEYLRIGCGATLDLMYSQPADSRDPRAGEVALALLAGEMQIGTPHVHLLHGSPEITLPRFTREQDYDVCFLGALTHRRGFAALVGTLTERLLEGLECDCVVVKSANYESPYRHGVILAAVV